MGYLGKISAIVSANTSDFSAKLAASGKEVQSWARSLNSAVNSASSKASSSLRGIYTEAQKAERALQAIQAKKIDFKGFDAANLGQAVGRMQALISATKGVNEPLNRAARSLEKLPVAMQGGFIEAMKRAQLQAERLAVEVDKIGSGSLVSNSALEKKFEAIAARAMMTAQSVDRLKEAASAVGGLASGTEIRFRNPEFAGEMARARGLQERAAASRGGDFSGIIQRQAAAANELATAFARMEESRLVANGDVAGATAAYERQLTAVQQIGNELEAAIAASQAGAEAEREREASMRRSAEVASTLLNVLQQESALLSSQGAATDVRGRLQAAQAVQRATQEEATYRERAAEQAEREAAALAQVVAQQNRAFLVERERRSGALARDNSAAFDAATEGLMASPAPTRENVFGPAARTVETELERTRAMYQEFIAMSPEVQASLEADRQALNNIAAGARDGAVSLGVLIDANDRWAASARAAGEAAEQAAARARVADDIASQERDLGGNLGTTSNVAAGQAAERRRQARESLGMDAPGPTEVPRELSATEGRINSLRSRLESLPAPLRQMVLPALAEIQNRFVQLAGAVNPTIDQIERLGTAIDHAEAGASRMEAALRLARGFGGAGEDGINLGLDMAAASRAEAQLNSLQAELSLVTAEARGPATAAFNAWRNAVSRAMADGTISTQRVSEEVEELRLRAVEAVAAVRGIDAGALDSRTQRAGSRRQGDIGRMGVGNASLAMQQLGFAVDDFMSSTGGVDQRIRAISNNISQMAFILGGTRGLFIGLGVTMAAQAALAFTKWVNGGRAAEDQTKALNDALSRQKSLVEELAQAFRSFGDSLSRGVYSQSAERDREFKKDSDEVMNKRREQSEGRVVDADINVNRERATQAMLERRMQGETVLGRMVALRQRLRESQDREREAAEAAKSAPAPTRGDVAGVLRRSAAAQVQTGEFTFGRPDEAIRARAAELMAGEINAGTSQEELLRMLKLQLSSVAEAQSDYAAMGFTDTPLDQSKQELEQAIAQLENSIRKSTDPVVKSILDAGIAINGSLTAVQQLLDQATAPFSKTRDEAEKVADRMKEITTELEKGTTPERNAVLQKEMEALRQQAESYRSAAEVIRTFADTVKRISTDLASEVESETRSSANQARRAANEATAVAERGGEFGPNGERRRPDDPADLRRAEKRAIERREEAEKEARRAQDAADRVRSDNDRLREEFESKNADDPQVMAERKRLQELQATIESDGATPEEKSRAAEEKARIRRDQERRFEDSEQGRKAAAAADLADEEAASEREKWRQEDETLNAARRGRDEVETPAQREARRVRERQRDLFDARDEYGIPQAEINRASERISVEESERRRQEEKSIRDADPRERGRRLGMTDREQFRQDALDGVGYDGAMRRAQIQAEGGNVDAFIKQFTANQMEQVAPMLAQFQQERETAIAGGPSRAALTASDVTTSQGMSELNRLLRGDDASKDVNLAELQKQTDRLTELVDIVKNNPVPVL